MIIDDAISKLVKAGEIAKRAREYTERIVKPGVKLVEVAEAIEKYIRELGGEPAFPVNIGINNIAAHYTPIYEDPDVIPENAVVKIDLGVHVDGYIADTATTLCFVPVLEGLVEAAKRALEKALEVVRYNVRAYEIGRVVEEVIRAYGYKPIRNLSGHSIDRYVIHSGLTIPNYNDRLSIHRLGEGVYAIEPFASTGKGLVREASIVTIYALRQTRRKIPDTAKWLYEEIYSSRKTLPFTQRWYIKTPGDKDRVNQALNELKREKTLNEYPVLVEEDKSAMIAQFEHTVVVTKREVIITTA